MTRKVLYFVDTVARAAELAQQGFNKTEILPKAEVIFLPVVTGRDALERSRTQNHDNDLSRFPVFALLGHN